MPERLRRLDEVFDNGPIYFVAAYTAARKPLLAKAAIHDSFKAFAMSGEGVGALVGAYILLPDHLHLFVSLNAERILLSQWMKAPKGKLSTELRASGQCAPFWQKGFFDHVLRSKDSYSAKWDYVRENAVRAGLVPNWEAWPYLGEIFPLELRKGPR